MVRWQDTERGELPVFSFPGASQILLVSPSPGHTPILLLHLKIGRERPLRLIQEVRNAVLAFRDVQIAIHKFLWRKFVCRECLSRSAKMVGEAVKVRRVVIPRPDP